MRTKTLLTIIAVEIAILIAVVAIAVVPPGAPAGDDVSAMIEAESDRIEEETRDEIEDMDPGDVVGGYLDERSRDGLDGIRDDAAGEIDDLLREFEGRFD